MKTAMELALARIEMLYGKKDDIHWEMFKNDCMGKEEEQIIDAYRSGHSDRSFEKYNPYFYEETYNQNQNL